MIDRYDAPDGMVAVRGYDGCEGCCLDGKGCIDEMGCDKNMRQDDTDIIFKTRADFEKMLMQEIELFYGKGKVKRIVFTEECNA